MENGTVTPGERGPTLSAEDKALRVRIVSYVRMNLARRPSVGDIRRKFKINRTRYYRLFPGGKMQMYSLAGHRNPVDDSAGPDLLAARTVQVPSEPVTAKEKYEALKAKVEEELVDLSYQARISSDKMWVFASKALPFAYPELWKKVLLLSPEGPEIAIKEAIELAGWHYTALVLGDIARGVKREDSYTTLLSWLVGITEKWINSKISQRKVGLIPMNISNKCPGCGEGVQVKADHKLECTGCGSLLNWMCPICDQIVSKARNFKNFSCPNCRTKFEDPLIPPRREDVEVESEAIIDLRGNIYGDDTVYSRVYIVEHVEGDLTTQTFYRRFSRDRQLV